MYIKISFPFLYVQICGMRLVIFKVSVVEWMSCNFTSFLTIFKSYQAYGRVIMKGCLQWNSVLGWGEFVPPSDLESVTAKSADQYLPY